MRPLALALLLIAAAPAQQPVPAPVPSPGESIKPAEVAPTPAAPPAPALTMPALPPAIVFPTANHALLEGKPEDFFQFVDRNFQGKVSAVWEGGQFGFVRNPLQLKSGDLIYTRFHEGLDIKPMKRDAKGEPLDEVQSIADGEVVHCSTKAGASNYGCYVVVRHDWPDGPFCSLYAHLSSITCKPGDRVQAGGKLGIMGHTGAGIDQRRSHVHVELCLYLSSRFSVWHDHQTSSLNYHGMWNGLNLVGLDLSQLYRERAKTPQIPASELVKRAEPHFKIAVAGTAEMELLEHYPWLCPIPVPMEKPKSWEITFTQWGLPVRIEPRDQPETEPRVTWVKPSDVSQSSLTRGLLYGTGSMARLTNDGLSYINLATGLFSAKPKPAQPAATKKPAPPPVKKKKK